MADILKVEDLHVSFDTYAGEVHSVRGVSFTVGRAKCLLSWASPAAVSRLRRKPL